MLRIDQPALLVMTCYFRTNSLSDTPLANSEIKVRLGEGTTPQPLDVDRFSKTGTTLVDLQPGYQPGASNLEPSIQMPRLDPQSSMTHHRPLNFDIRLRYDYLSFLGGLYE